MVPRSIRRELPLLISALLIVVVGVVSWSAYRTVESALGAAAVSHLATAAEELASNLDQSGRRLRSDAARTADDAAIVRFLSRRDVESAAEARRAVDRLRATRTQSYTLAVRDREGTALFSVGDAGGSMVGGLALRSGAGNGAEDDGPRVRLVADGDTVYLYIVAVVTGASADTLGFVTEYRRISGGAQVGLLAGLIGEETRFAIGNPDGSVWTDLVRAVPGPPVDVLDQESGQYTASDGTGWLAAASAVPSTSWRVWVEVPTRVVMAPAGDVLRRILAIALLIVAAGVFGAWLLCRRITAPLADIARAAEGIAGGDYGTRARVQRRDELGRLATSFNSMAARVEEAAHSLEVQAAELEIANADLAAAIADTEGARQAAEQSATELRAVLDLVTDIVLILDGDGRYVRILETSSDALVRPAEELVGRRVHEVMSSASADAVLATVRSAVAERHRVEVEYSLELGERGTHWFAGAASPMADGCVYWVARDITERRRLEAQLRQSQKMEAIGQLAGGIAHDFNNMLTAIKSFSELLLSDIPADSPHRSDVTEIQSAADRAAVLTRQLLAFSRRQLLQPVPLDLNAVVAGLEEMLRRLLGEDVELVCHLDPGLAAAIADPGQVEQIVMNLAVNARDAMPAGGRLTVETTNGMVDAEYAAHAGDLRPGAYVVLAVSDTGTGMEPAVQARIFEPFFTTKEPGKGTGLGLSTVYGIVKQSGGHISVYSEPGRGTTLRIHVPVADSALLAVPPSAAVIANMSRGSETILLVEDDPAVRLVAARILARQGYRVLEAPAPAAARALVAAHPGVIDLVMTDLVLPEMSGRELCDLLTAVEPELRILYMSGYTDDAVIRRGLLEPGMPFLSKPFTVHDVARMVRQTLDSAPAHPGSGNSRSRPRSDNQC